MREKDCQILMTKISAYIDSGIASDYPIKKAKMHVQTKCECIIPQASDDLMKSILKLTTIKHEYFKALSQVELALYKEKNSPIDIIKNSIVANIEPLIEEDQSLEALNEKK